LESIHISIVDDFKNMFFKDRKRIFFIQAKRDFKHFFLFIYQTKRTDPKKDLKLFLSNRKFSLPFFNYYYYYYYYYYYDFLSKSSMYRSHALFVWLFNILFTRYWKISCTCLTFMDLDLFLYPPFPFYLFFYRNQLSFLWLHFCMT